MLRSEPPAGALPLLEAFLRFGNRDAAELVRQQPSRLWCDQDGPVAEAKEAFLARLGHGQLVAWAREPGEFSGRRWSLVSARAWAQLEVGDWQHGTLIHVSRPPSWQHRSRRVQRVTAGWSARVAEYPVEEPAESPKRKGLAAPLPNHTKMQP